MSFIFHTFTHHQGLLPTETKMAGFIFRSKLIINIQTKADNEVLPCQIISCRLIRSLKIQ